MTTNEPTASAGTMATAPAVRPKILKRPAQFSAHAPAISNHSSTADAVRITAEPAPANAATASKPWQDDGRFAITLLAIIIVLNVALSYWLAGAHRRALVPAPLHSIEMPAATNPGTTTSSSRDPLSLDEDTSVHPLDNSESGESQ